ncbi:MAG TPA: right-handed parallel beta-helix repeat-containing protein [Dehalococcoidia bacterium]|nr:right-handed parallel beta-helix repeat-containing protein [Dehalococcoidia bacterium]
MSIARFLVALVAVLALATLSHGEPAMAAPAEYTVDSTTDSPDSNPGDGVCESIAGGCSLRAAIQEANADAEAQTITLPPGTFALTIAGASENQGATGDLDITEDLTIIGSGPVPAAASSSSGPGTIIDANGLDRVFHVLDGVTFTVSGATITGGSAPEDEGGAGVWARPDSSVTLDTVVVTENQTSGLSNSKHVGGAVLNGEGAVTISNTLISNNVADRGGGIFNAGTMTVESSTIAFNSARAVGGILTYFALELTNSTVTGNTATNNSSGVFVDGGETIPDFEVNILNSTIANNPGNDYINGLINRSDTGTVTNTIIANNGFSNCDGDIISGGHNIGTDDTCSFNAAGDLPNVPNAGLAPLADYGGPTKTISLLEGSPAIDAGDNAACPATDQRGVARPIDGDGVGGAVCDIGAVETEDPIAGTSVAWGDWNCSGATDPVDALLTLRFDAGLSTNTGACPPMGDIVDVNGSARPWGDGDCSGAADPVDALKLLRFDAGLSVTQEPQCPQLGGDVIVAVDS